jgi:hypothetical protein
MKHKILALILMLAVLCVSTFSFVPSSVAATDEPVVEQEKVEYNPQKALEVRFENILNRNFSYNEEIADIDVLVNNSILAILDKREESFIAEDIVANFVCDMYGIEIVDFSELNANMPKKEGYVYILPRGYELYSHKVESVTLNEDCSYTVKTNVSISTSSVLYVLLVISSSEASFKYIKCFLYSNSYLFLKISPPFVTPSLS